MESTLFTNILKEKIMEKFKLYGDGIHDDYAGIQELLDSRKELIELPIPEKCYLISKTLKIHGGQTLKLSPYTEIYLMEMSNCAMLEDDDFSTFKQNICIDGGIWDMNNDKQEPNPWRYAGRDGKTTYDRFKEIGFNIAKADVLCPVYTGFCMRFCRVKNFVMKNVTFRNAVTYGVQVSYMENFTFRDMHFDFHRGAPKLWNMDGIHVEGNCKNGYICNLKGTCHDDFVAITADDYGPYGPIENIVVDGVFAENTHSAVRLLSHGEPVKNITIKNIFGTYYRYAITLSKYHGGPEERGYMENISIDNVSASFVNGTVDVPNIGWPLIYVTSGLDIKSLRIENVFRNENFSPSPTLGVEKDTKIDGLILKNLELINNTGKEMKQVCIDGEVENFSDLNVD